MGGPCFFDLAPATCFCASVAYQTAPTLIRHNRKRHSPTPADKMDIDDNDDDFYAPEEPAAPAAQPDGAATTTTAPAAESESKPDQDEDLEEGEEEDEGGAMDEDDSSDDVSMNSTLGLLPDIVTFG